MFGELNLLFFSTQKKHFYFMLAKISKQELLFIIFIVPTLLIEEKRRQLCILPIGEWSSQVLRWKQEKSLPFHTLSSILQLDESRT